MSKLKRYNVHSGHPDIDTWTEETTDGVWVDAEEAEADKAAALEQERERSRRLLEAAKIGLSWLQSDHTGRSGDLTGGDIGKIESAIKAYEGLDKTGEQEVG